MIQPMWHLQIEDNGAVVKDMFFMNRDQAIATMLTRANDKHESIQLYSDDGVEVPSGRPYCENDIEDFVIGANGVAQVCQVTVWAADDFVITVTRRSIHT